MFAAIYFSFPIGDNLWIYTIYVQIFEVCNFHGFRGWLAIREIFILEIYWRYVERLLFADIGVTALLKA